MATETNKRKLEANSVSPEGCKSKKSKKKRQKQRGNSNSESSVCCICNCVIEEGTDEKDGEDGIFCEGSCNSWLHRKCAGLSNSIFQHLSDSKTPFLCVYCLLTNQAAQIAELKSTLAQLTSKFSNLSNTPTNLLDDTVVVSSKPDKPKPDKPKPNIVHSEKKFNVVVYGIEESPPETKKESRAEHDLQHLITSLSTIDSSIKSHSVKDCFRLGKFKAENKKPRPLLVKFLRSADTANILRNRAQLSHPIYVKPDLTPEEKTQESMLLKERRSLIDKGVDRKQIKLRSWGIFIDDKPHCKIVDRKLKFLSASPYAPAPSPNSQVVPTIPMVISDQSGSNPQAVPTSPMVTNDQSG